MFWFGVQLLGGCGDCLVGFGQHALLVAVQLRSERESAVWLRTVIYIGVSHLLVRNSPRRNHRKMSEGCWTTYGDPNDDISARLSRSRYPRSSSSLCMRTNPPKTARPPGPRCGRSARRVCELHSIRLGALTRPRTALSYVRRRRQTTVSLTQPSFDCVS